MSLSAGCQKHKIWAGVAPTLCCCLIALQPMVAGARSKKASTGIQGQDRILHALNRFTFGPRPGEIEAVEAMGLRKWFDQQLNPSTIDDSALDARLAMFPAMNLSQPELMARFPSQQRLRQMIRIGEPLPADPIEHAIYGDNIASYMQAKARREAAAQAANGTASKKIGNGMMAAEAALPGDTVDPRTPSMEAHEQQLYSGLDAVRIINLPPDSRMQRIVGMSPEDFIAFRRSLNPGEIRSLQEGLNPQQKETLEALQSSSRMVDNEVLQSRLIRDIYSQRQLQAVMTDFWLNHFNVYLRKNQYEPYLLPAFERDVIRPNALGKFENLLVATAKSPAMLVYLDNWLSIGPDSIAAKNAERRAQRAKNPQAKKALKDRGLNENYGRELMELHTLGVQCEVSADRPAKELDKACGKGYTQQDVISVAKALTGWTISRPDQGAEYQFDPRRHEPGTKIILGKKIKENGEQEGLEVLHMLATSPATAKFISTKLAIRFVSDNPPPALVDRMTKSFLSSGGDIKTVLRTMFDSPEFWSPEVYRAKIKTPIEFVVSAARATGADVTNAQPLVASLNRLGMPLYGMQTPNGYSWSSDAWVNTGDLVNRMNFALILSSDRMNGIETDWRGLLKEPESGALSLSSDTAAAAKEKSLESILLGQSASTHTRETVLQQFQNTSAQEDAVRNFGITTKRREPMARVLNAASPVRQTKPADDREAEVMAGLLLGSPDFQRR
ncbi:MAG TPA: DUF1800 domain-containing protein [Edaphobacter sp.]|nr:DUF1800 domain-containing protein [Edaphobacter sp.]